MPVSVVEGDLLDQRVDALVNAWNRNVLPWWLLLPQGVSGAIKRRAGTQPFRELARMGPIPLGHAVHTSAGKLPYRVMLHVAGIDLLWRASRASIVDSTTNAVALARTLGLESIAMPIIGAGSGSFSAPEAEGLMLEALESAEGLAVTVVHFRSGKK
jgi:O-acetyl-ADP-ribose deacetylase (regulator of RNase III)